MTINLASMKWPTTIKAAQENLNWSRAQRDGAVAGIKNVIKENTGLNDLGGLATGAALGAAGGYASVKKVGVQAATAAMSRVAGKQAVQKVATKVVTKAVLAGSGLGTLPFAASVVVSHLQASIPATAKAYAKYQNASSPGPSTAPGAASRHIARES